MSSQCQCLKRARLTDIVKRALGVFDATLYDGTVLDRDGEGIDWTGVRAVEPLTAQIDHDHSVLATVGHWTGIHVAGQRLRGTVTFAPAGVSEIADQVRRQVEAGVTSTISIGFRGQPQQARDGHRVWTNVELLEASFVSVPASPGARVDQKALRQWLRRAAADDTDVVLEITDDEPGVEFDDSVVRWLREIKARARLNPARQAGMLGEETVDFDPHDVAAAMCETVPRVLRDEVRHQVQRALNQLLRGRLD